MAEPISIEDLLTHTDWIHGLARELVRDRHRADDLAQGSVAAALATRPRRAGIGLRAWLHRVMVNRLRQDRRNEATRTRLRPDVARPAETPSTLALVARTEIQGALIQELVALEEPYRTTILHRYYDDRSAADIARGEGLPESTVRSRLQRGLERLRKRLRARYGGDDTQWLSAVAGLVRGRGALLRLAKAQKLALTAVSLVGLAVLGTVLAPFGGTPSPPDAVSTAAAYAERRSAAGDLDSPVSAIDSPALERRALPASAGETFEVRVRAADGSPAPGARVRFVLLRQALEENLRHGGPPHPHSEVYRFAFLAESYGDELRTDERGGARLPVPAARLLVAVLHESAFAATSVPGGQRDPVTVDLAPDGALELRTVDRSGRRAGSLPLRVAVRVPGKPDNTLWVGETGEDGAVTVPHFQLLQPADRSGARYGVCFDFPAKPHVTLGFGDPPPRAPVVLTVPDHGLLELSFTDAGGAPLHLPIEYCRLQIEFARGEGEVEAFPPEERRWVGGFPVVGEHSLRLPVGLDARVTATGQFRTVGEIERASFPGPARPGEVVTRSLALSRRFTVVRGVLGSGGTALTGIQARAVLIRPGDQRVLANPTPLGGGAFELIVPSGAGPRSLYLHARDADGQELGAQLPLPAGEVVSLGGVELAPLTRVVDGVIVDERGSPVAGAEIQAWRWMGGAWARDERFRALAGPDGAFRLSLPESEVELGLLPRRRGYLVKGPVLPGPKTFEMVRSGTVSGSLLVPEWLEPSTLAVRIASLADAGRTVEVEPERRRGRTAFRVSDLWPGRYRVLVQVDGEPEPFRDLGVFDVAAGTELGDDRLAGVELRNDLFRIELTAADDRGIRLDLPGAGLCAFLAGTDGTVHRRNLRWRDGRAVVITSRRSLDVELAARGYVSWRGTVHPGATVVTLRAAR